VFVLRAVLIAVFRDASATMAQLGRVVAAGTATDLLVGVVALLPFWSCRFSGCDCSIAHGCNMAWWRSPHVR
jgi:hypothetical protein